VFPKIGAKFYG